MILDRILLAHAPAVNSPVTDPRDADTDGDGVADGTEVRVAAHWFEAEHFAMDASRIRQQVGLSNGADLEPDASGRVLRITDPQAFYEGGAWTVFVRAQSDVANPANKLLIRVLVGGGLIATWQTDLVVQVGRDPHGAIIHANFWSPRMN
ncbi:MAG: hypothetical protein JXP34_18480 [Planctomycetes bacterium]|nr:hypothetical protein [Planctomycetota bacterium]